MAHTVDDSGGSGRTDAAREPRSPRVFVTTIRTERLGEQTITVRNLSPFGLGARLRSHRLVPGERITVSLNDESVDAEVCWVRHGSFGARLAREIDPARFTFGHKNWASATRPFPRGHVYDQFRPVSNSRRPGLKFR